MHKSLLHWQASPTSRASAPGSAPTAAPASSAGCWASCTPAWPPPATLCPTGEAGRSGREREWLPAIAATVCKLSALVLGSLARCLFMEAAFMSAATVRPILTSARAGPIVGCWQSVCISQHQVCQNRMQVYAAAAICAGMASHSGQPAAARGGGRHPRRHRGDPQQLFRQLLCIVCVLADESLVGPVSLS